MLISMMDRDDLLDEAETVDGSLAGDVRASVARLHRRLRQEERPPHELGMTAMSVLSSLHRLGPFSPTQLAEREQVQPQTMTRTLATLRQRDLIVRSAHPTDRRQAVISITAAGDALLSQDRQWRDQWLAGAIEKLSPLERQLLGVVSALLNQLASS
jgi:DNA-binding MarR family transcriptional regulator